MEIRTSHSSEPVEAEAIRIAIHDKEFMIQQVADGLKVIEVTNSDILIRPQTANSMVMITRR